MSIYETRKNLRPDSDFEPGEYAHLVIGNTGRSLDSRRTPVRIVDLLTETGLFVVRIEAFEDEGARWQIPFEEVKHYQFLRGEARAAAEVIRTIEQGVERLDRPLVIPCDPDVTRATRERLRLYAEEATVWFQQRPTPGEDRDLPDPETRVGDPRRWDDLERFMTDHDLVDMEKAFARQFVSNPYSGELVKGHRVVIAELGLVAYQDKVVRDPDLFREAWARDRRVEHVLRRMAFVRSMFRRLGHEQVRLYRGMSFPGPLAAPRNETFVSASFSQEVARSHYELGGKEWTSILYGQTVPVGRVFMTYYETREMNEQFKEAEAVLLFDQDNRVF